MQVFTSLDQLKGAVGVDLGVSDWLEILQQRVDQFAETTGDHQWIHVDPERAATGPFGGTIAHGWLTASILPVLTQQIYRVEAKMAVNYGLNKLRFPSPVPVGSSVRAASTFKEISDVGAAVQLVTATTIHVRGADKPAVVAETVSRYYW
jgi:acyl dehydratase